MLATIDSENEIFDRNYIPPPLKRPTRKFKPVFDHLDHFLEGLPKQIYNRKGSNRAQNTLMRFKQNILNPANIPLPQTPPEANIVQL